VHSTKTISNLCHAKTLEEGRQVGRCSTFDETGTHLVHQCIPPNNFFDKPALQKAGASVGLPPHHPTVGGME